ncbi:MAG: peptidase [candidate division NC10 bacterium]|nr:peptidase [candidate division NC10 bacterium]
MGVLLLFVDGLGLGEDDPGRNPVARARLRRLRLLRDRPAPDPAAVLVPTDACLDVAGLPQSATGQTSILTGVNAPATVGRHINGYCTKSLAEILDGRSLFSRVTAAGGEATFANAYTPAFLEKLPRFLSVSTVAMLRADLRFRTLDDLARGEALFHDFTNRLLPERGYSLPTISPGEAGRRLARLAKAHAFTMYEHFLTDRTGHAQDMARGVEILEDLEALLDGVLSMTDRSADLVILTSDHGNLEDLSTSRHTRNPVPTLLWGAGAAEAAAGIQDLTDIAPAILRHLGML